LKVTPTDTGTIPQDPNNPTHTKPNPTQRKIPNEDHAHDDNASLSGQQTMSSSTINSASYTPSPHLHLLSASTQVTVCRALTPSRATSQHRCSVKYSGMVQPRPVVGRHSGTVLPRASSPEYVQRGVKQQDTKKNKKHTRCQSITRNKTAGYRSSSYGAARLLPARSMCSSPSRSLRAKGILIQTVRNLVYKAPLPEPTPTLFLLALTAWKIRSLKIAVRTRSSTFTLCSRKKCPRDPNRVQRLKKSLHSSLINSRT